MAADVHEVPLRHNLKLELFHDLDHFDLLLAELREKGRQVSRALGKRRVWMLSSTASGGGVAEMMPSLCNLLVDLGVDTRWLVLEPDDPGFFELTKALHNMFHGQRGIEEPEAARAIYERVCAEAAAKLRGIHHEDLVVVHDPQPVGIGVQLHERIRPLLLWRCHVGVSNRNEHTDAAWSFLRPYLGAYQRLLFSSLSYAPAEWLERSGELCPGIDPLSHKNRSLRPYKLVGVLRSAGLIDGPPVPPWARFRAQVHRWSGQGWEATPIVDLLHVPTIVQVSRFDRLKGFEFLLPAFEALLHLCPGAAPRMKIDSERVLSEMERIHLLLAGPDPAGVSDDPEARTVLDELCALHAGLPPKLRARVHVLRLPMIDRKENALIVNALQRLAGVVVQNSIQEGFGLTVSEALWKRTPVVAANVGGIAAQLRDGKDGVLIDDPKDPGSIAGALLRVLSSPLQAEAMGRSGHVRVRDHFTILAQARSWLDAFLRVLGGDSPGSAPGG